MQKSNFLTNASGVSNVPLTDFSDQIQPSTRNKSVGFRLKDLQFNFPRKGGTTVMIATGMDPDNLPGLRRRSSVGLPVHCQQRAKRHTTNYKLMKFREKVMAGVSTNELLKMKNVLNEQQPKGLKTAQPNFTKCIVPKAAQLAV